MSTARQRRLAAREHLADRLDERGARGRRAEFHAYVKLFVWRRRAHLKAFWVKSLKTVWGAWFGTAVMVTKGRGAVKQLALRVE